MPWCSCCGKEAGPWSLKIQGGRLYFCEGCAKGFCLIGGEGVRYGPVGTAWGLERSDPLVGWTRNTSADCTDGNDVDCTDINMDDL